MNIALMQKGSSKNEFPHWSETLSALTYATEQKADELVEFCHYRKITPENWYIDPLGKVQKSYTQGDFSKDTPLIVNGSIHLETSPMSYGVIPYNKFKYKIAIEHTTGYSPWDYLQMVDLANISRDNPKDAGGCKLRFLMNKKFYNRFMKVDWNSVGYSDYENYKPIIEQSIKDGYVKLESYEPTQFWLDTVPTKVGLEQSNHICLVLNWANFKKGKYVQQIVEICRDLHKYTGLDIDIKLHSYCKESFLKYFEAFDFIHIIPYLNTSKYDIMDKYSLFFVDSTGFGYECSYRNMKKGRNIDIFYVSGLPAEDTEFRGTKFMGVNPVYTHIDFLNGVTHSNYPEDVIKESFPHKGNAFDNIKEVYGTIIKNCNEIKQMFPLDEGE